MLYSLSAIFVVGPLLIIILYPKPVLFIVLQNPFTTLVKRIEASKFGTIVKCSRQ
jgi:hypothetical protein